MTVDTPKREEKFEKHKIWLRYGHSRKNQNAADMKRDCERKADELGSDSTAAVMPIRSGVH